MILINGADIVSADISKNILLVIDAKNERITMLKYFYLISLLFCFFSCGNHVKKEFSEGLLCRCIVFPTGTLCDTYQINVYEDGTICTFFGLRSEDFDSLARCGKVMKEHVFEKVETKKTSKLQYGSIEQLNKYLSAINENRCFHSNALNWKDSWCVVIETGTSVSLHNIGDFDNNNIEFIYEMLKKNSPIIVDVHGWS
jgi:hypothetical protein